MKNATLSFVLLFGSVSYAAAQEKKSDTPAATLPAPSTPPAGMRELSVGKYITGGVLGSAVGLGIGHAIQGTWRDIGWVFSIGEGICYTVMFVSLVNAVADRDKDDERLPRFTSTATGALIVASGFRIWETIDIWTRPVWLDGKRYVRSEQPGFRVALGAASMDGRLAPGLNLQYRY